MSAVGVLHARLACGSARQLTCTTIMPPRRFFLCRHGGALAALDRKLDGKWLNTEGRVKLRLVWDRTR